MSDEIAIGGSGEPPAFEFKEYKIFNTVVNGKLAEVWRRKEKHPNGQWNGTPEDYWLKDPTHGEWIPWVDKCVNRSGWEVKLQVGNRTKHKWGETSVNPTGYAEIFCNLRKVYEFGGWDIDYLFTRAHYLIGKMREHIFPFNDPDTAIGRKIWYKRQPAIISSLVLDQGCIMIEKDGEGGFDMTNPWDREDDFGTSEWHGQKRVKDDIMTASIWWFRD